MKFQNLEFIFSIFYISGPESSFTFPNPRGCICAITTCRGGSVLDLLDASDRGVAVRMPERRPLQPSLVIETSPARYPRATSPAPTTVWCFRLREGLSSKKNAAGIEQSRTNMAPVCGLGRLCSRWPLEEAILVARRENTRVLSRPLIYGVFSALISSSSSCRRRGEALDASALPYRHIARTLLGKHRLLGDVVGRYRSYDPEP